MAEGHRYIGLRDFVEELSWALQRASFPRPWRRREDLLVAVEGVVSRFLEEVLGPRLPHRVLRGSEVVEGDLSPVVLLGVSFVPDLVIEVSGQPTLAVEVHLARGKRVDGQRLGAVLGRALAFSYRYPAVLSLVFSPDRALEPRSLLDREMLLDLWTSHKVRLVFL